MAVQLAARGDVPPAVPQPGAGHAVHGRPGAGPEGSTQAGHG